MGVNEMRNLKSLISSLIMFILACSLLIGCSSIETGLNQSLSNKSPHTQATDIQNPVNENSSNSLGEDRTTTDSQPLESWIGDYTFSEFAPPNQNMFYRISIYKENDDYYAEINIDGFQTIRRLQAKVIGDESSIKLIFNKYLPENLMEPYVEGDILLSFEKRNSHLYTFWGKIQPILENNTKSGDEYFKVES